MPFVLAHFEKVCRHICEHVLGLGTHSCEFKSMQSSQCRVLKFKVRGEGVRGGSTWAVLSPSLFSVMFSAHAARVEYHGSSVEIPTVRHFLFFVSSLDRRTGST